MKRLIIPSLMFFAMLLTIMVNRGFVLATCEELYSLTNELPPDGRAAADTIGRIDEYFSERARWLSFSVSRDELAEFKLALTALSVQAKYGDPEEYYEAQKRLIIAIDGLIYLERFSPENLF